MTQLEYEILRLCSSVVNEAVQAVDPRLIGPAVRFAGPFIHRSLAADLHAALGRFLQQRKTIPTNRETT